METVVSMLAFLALVVSWFVLPATTPVRAEATSHTTVPEALPSAA